MTASSRKSTKATEVQAYKGFDKDLKCLGYQYEVGKTYEHDGDVRLCRSGFHSVDGNPLDVLDFYPLIGDDGSLNRFCSVVASGEIKRDETSKICSAKLTVKAELKLPDLIAAAIKYVSASCKGADTVASGYSSKLAASGDRSKLAASGDYSQLAASGYYSQLAASGDCSKLAASGYYSQLAASGYCSKLAASGDYSKLAASGDYSQLAASGYSSKLEISGGSSAGAVVGPNSTIKAVAGTPIAICEYDASGKPIRFVCGIAGEDCPADTWLKAKGGKLVAA